MTLVDGRQVFEPLQPLQLKASLVLIELGAGHAALATGDTDVAQCLRELEHTQALMGDLVGRILAQSGFIALIWSVCSPERSRRSRCNRQSLVVHVPAIGGLTSTRDEHERNRR